MEPKQGPRWGSEFGFSRDGRCWTREWRGDRVTEYREGKYRVGRQINGKTVWCNWAPLP